MSLLFLVAVVIILLLMFGTGGLFHASPPRPNKTANRKSSATAELLNTQRDAETQLATAIAAEFEQKNQDFSSTEIFIDDDSLEADPETTVVRPENRSGNRKILGAVALLLFGLIGSGLFYLRFVHNKTDNQAIASSVLPADPCTPPGTNQARITAFVKAECYRSWLSETPPVKLSGAGIDGVYYTRHQYLQVYYSPKVATWLANQRRGTMPDDSMIVALEYAEGEQPGALQRVLTKVKDNAGSKDGWFWSSIEVADDAQHSQGQFGAPSCVACHSSADNREMTFLGPGTDPQLIAEWKPARSLRWPEPEPPVIKRQLPQPLAEPDQGFLDYFKLPDIPASEVVPFPAKKHDHVLSGHHSGVNRNQLQVLVTSDQCIGCHNANQLLSNSTPNMWYPNPEDDNDKNAPYRNYSPYGEWSASMNALSSRDPVWHAQVESERFLRPHLADFTDDACFSCHAPLAGRQLRIDSGDPNKLFTIDMFYALAEDANGKYGALARDGVSCVACHAMTAEDLGVDPEIDATSPHHHKHPSELMTYTALFNVGQILGGPYPEGKINAVTMTRATGMTATFTSHTGEARLCGSCHTVIVPALPVGYQGTDPHNDPSIRIAFEQTTYWEWRNSVFQNERTPKGEVAVPCQSCHMFPHKRQAVANIESDEFPPLATRLTDKQLSLRKQNPVWRHTLMGINIPVYKMFQQFPDVLGAQLHDPTVPEQTLNPMLNAEDFMEAFAENKVANITILGAEPVSEPMGRKLEVKLQVNNMVGHKLPSGAGFRRVFVELRVLDDKNNTLWVSGATDRFGAIIDGKTGAVLRSEFTRDPNLSQPHYQQITHQDQVQIYETRSLDSEGKLQTTVLGIYREYKDNRLLPLGWEPDGPNTFVTVPKLPAPAKQRYLNNIKHREDGTTEGRYNTNCYDGYDPDYCEKELTRNGQDHLSYLIYLDEIQDWARIEARLYYQTIPPYYLADRFRLGQEDGPGTGSYGRDTKRLIHIASRLNFADSAVDQWKMQLGKTAVLKKGEAAQPGWSFEETIEKMKVPNAY